MQSSSSGHLKWNTGGSIKDSGYGPLTNLLWQTGGVLLFPDSVMNWGAVVPHAVTSEEPKQIERVKRTDWCSGLFPSALKHTNSAISLFSCLFSILHKSLGNHCVFTLLQEKKIVSDHLFTIFLKLLKHKIQTYVAPLTSTRLKKLYSNHF